ncbi:MAG: bifunctional diaminohydroxyphosphoribosylaminopyrimidine deaminase/5-amino-6-(5-phosphoribosylamino)uracil reductase RibD, partial [Waterburya sp.]
DKKIPRVVVASDDPNPNVSGKGFELLRSHGVEVTTQVLKSEADAINRRFLTFFTQKRPYIILKFAQSEDGFIGKNGERTQITGEQAGKLNHQWRSQEMAIMVGTNTVEVDNPSLTVRNVDKEGTRGNPIRLVLDANLRLNESKNIYNKDSKTIIITSKHNDVEEFNGKDFRELSDNVSYLKIDFSNNIIPQIIEKLFKLNIQTVIVEGGTQLINSFIEADIWDEARVFSSKVSLENGIAAPDLEIIKQKALSIKEEEVGEDKLTWVIR